MKEIECRKGFTTIELVLAIAILAMLANIVVLAIVPSAHGAEIITLESQKLLPANDNMAKAVIRQLEQDPKLNVIVLAYVSEWAFETVDPSIEESKRIFRTLIDAGISDSRITWLFANKGGLEEDPIHTPSVDGTYLILTY